MGNTLGILGTYWEPHGNRFGTSKEHVGNKGKMKNLLPPTPPKPKTLKKKQIWGYLFIYLFIYLGTYREGVE
jgi:hypothetical protein